MTTIMVDADATSITTPTRSVQQYVRVLEVKITYVCLCASKE